MAESPKGASKDEIVPTSQEHIHAVALELMKEFPQRGSRQVCEVNPLEDLLKAVVEKVCCQEQAISQLQQQIESKSKEIESLSRKVEALEGERASSEEVTGVDTEGRIDLDGVQSLVKESVQGFESKLSSLQRDMGSLSEKHEGFLDKSRRQCNIIVGNLQEGDNEKRDKAGIVSFIEDKFAVKVDVSQVVRLGKSNTQTGTSSRSRLILVKLHSIEERNGILKNGRNCEGFAIRPPQMEK